MSVTRHTGRRLPGRRLGAPAWMVLGLAAAGLPVGCGGGDDRDDAPEVPNPAAVYCESLGGTTSGPEPMCELPDGRTLDAWELYRTDVVGESTTTPVTTPATTPAADTGRSEP